ncbi:MAG: fibronectin type III domain-containing protein [Cellulomonas sp.]|nr:fibronectin type III domain-containing protein [Cellulomonas sp.]
MDLGCFVDTGSRSLLLEWTPLTSDGGFPITDYVIQTPIDGVTWTTVGDGVSTTTSTKITGLERRTGYTVRVAAVSDVS